MTKLLRALVLILSPSKKGLLSYLLNVEPVSKTVDNIETALGKYPVFGKCMVYRQSYDGDNRRLAKLINLEGLRNYIKLRQKK